MRRWQRITFVAITEVDADPRCSAGNIQGITSTEAIKQGYLTTPVVEPSTTPAVNSITFLMAIDPMQTH